MTSLNQLNTKINYCINKLQQLLTRPIVNINDFARLIERIELLEQFQIQVNQHFHLIDEKLEEFEQFAADINLKVDSVVDSVTSLASKVDLLEQAQESTADLLESQVQRIDVLNDLQAQTTTLLNDVVSNVDTLTAKTDELAANQQRISDTISTLTDKVTEVEDRLTELDASIEGVRTYVATLEDLGLTQDSLDDALSYSITLSKLKTSLDSLQTTDKFIVPTTYLGDRSDLLVRSGAMDSLFTKDSKLASDWDELSLNDFVLIPVPVRRDFTSIIYLTNENTLDSAIQLTQNGVNIVCNVLYDGKVICQHTVLVSQQDSTVGQVQTDIFLAFRNNDEDGAHSGKFGRLYVPQFSLSTDNEWNVSLSSYTLSPTIYMQKTLRAITKDVRIIRFRNRQNVTTQLTDLLTIYNIGAIPLLVESYINNALSFYFDKTISSANAGGIASIQAIDLLSSQVSRVRPVTYQLESQDDLQFNLNDILFTASSKDQVEKWLDVWYTYATPTYYELKNGYGIQGLKLNKQNNVSTVRLRASPTVNTLTLGSTTYYSIGNSTYGGASIPITRILENKETTVKGTLTLVIDLTQEDVDKTSSSTAWEYLSGSTWRTCPTPIISILFQDDRYTSAVDYKFPSELDYKSPGIHIGACYGGMYNLLFPTSYKISGPATATDYNARQNITITGTFKAMLTIADPELANGQDFSLTGELNGVDKTLQMTYSQRILENSIDLVYESEFFNLDGTITVRRESRIHDKNDVTFSRNVSKNTGMTVSYTNEGFNMKTSVFSGLSSYNMTLSSGKTNGENMTWPQLQLPLTVSTYGVSYVAAFIEEFYSEGVFNVDYNGLGMIKLQILKNGNPFQYFWRNVQASDLLATPMCKLNSTSFITFDPDRNVTDPLLKQEKSKSSDGKYYFEDVQTAFKKAPYTVLSEIPLEASLSGDSSAIILPTGFFSNISSSKLSTSIYTSLIALFKTTYDQAEQLQNLTTIVQTLVDVVNQLQNTVNQLVSAVSNLANVVQQIVDSLSQSASPLSVLGNLLMIAGDLLEVIFPPAGFAAMVVGVGILAYESFNQGDVMSGIAQVVILSASIIAFGYNMFKSSSISGEGTLNELLEVERENQDQLKTELRDVVGYNHDDYSDFDSVLEFKARAHDTESIASSAESAFSFNDYQTSIVDRTIGADFSSIDYDLQSTYSTYSDSSSGSIGRSITFDSQKTVDFNHASSYTPKRQQDYKIDSSKSFEIKTEIRDQTIHVAQLAPIEEWDAELWWGWMLTSEGKRTRVAPVLSREVMRASQSVSNSQLDAERYCSLISSYNQVSVKRTAKFNKQRHDPRKLKSSLALRQQSPRKLLSINSAAAQSLLKLELIANRTGTLSTLFASAFPKVIRQLGVLE